MEKVLNIGGKEIKMKSSSAIIYVYRTNFNEDFMSKLIAMNSKMQKLGKDNEAEAIDYEFFLKSAWCMNKLADNSIPPFEEWLNQFGLLELMQAIPEIIPILTGELEQINDKKKLEQATISE